VKIIDFPQGSAEWRRARRPRHRLARVEGALARQGPQERGRDAPNYKAQIIAEILTGKPQEDDFTSDDMEGGIENEPFARGAYEVRINGSSTRSASSCTRARARRLLARRPGRRRRHGADQVPEAATHIATGSPAWCRRSTSRSSHWEMELRARVVRLRQLLPAFPAPLNLFVVRLHRDAARAEIAAEITQFNREVDEIIEKLTGKDVHDLERLGMKEAVL
jgi:hypothetical protein